MRPTLHSLSRSTTTTDHPAPDSDRNYGWYDTGPTLGVAVVSWLLGMLGAVVVLILRPRATTDQDGPFSKCVPAAAGGAKAEAPPVTVPYAVGQV